MKVALVGSALLLLLVAGLSGGSGAWAASRPTGGDGAPPTLVSGSAVTGVSDGQFRYVVFHALDRDGFCDAAAFSAVSLHPLLNLPVDFFIDAGNGRIIESAAGGAIVSGGRVATGVRTFSTYDNAASISPVKSFPPLIADLQDECQAWIRVSQTIPGPLTVTVVLHEPEGDYTKTVNLTFGAQPGGTQATISLSFRWSLVTWPGADGVSPAQATTGMQSQITAVYGWEATAQRWLSYFPGAVVAGANDLTALHAGTAYWVAIAGPGGVQWQVPPAP